jgi:hypothetical protein
MQTGAKFLSVLAAVLVVRFCSQGRGPSDLSHWPWEPLLSPGFSCILGSTNGWPYPRHDCGLQDNHAE